MKINNIFGINNKSSDEDLLGKDFLTLISNRPDYFSKMEHELNSKGQEESLQDIEKAIKLIEVEFREDFENFNEYIIILPRYEIWSILIVCHKLAASGRIIKIVYEKWCQNIVETIQLLNKGILHYQSLSFELIDNLSVEIEKNPIVINFADSVKGVISNIPSFSTIVISNDGDIDRAIAFTYENAFNFAGLMKSNIKRIIIDSNIYDKFVERITQRFRHLEQTNTEIKSSHTTNQLELLLSEAISEGADILLGDTNFNEVQSKTILKDIDYKMRIFQKNFYGPVLQLTKADTENADQLALIIKSQPSKGLLVFSEHELNVKTDKALIYRKFRNADPSILDEFPMVEYMINKFDLNQMK